MTVASSPASQASPIPAPERPMRIAIFTETFLPRTDGIATRLSHTIPPLHQMGHTLLVIAPKGGAGEFDGARVYGVPAFAFPLYPEIKAAIPRPSVGKILTEFRPDIIHAVQPVLLGLSAFYYSKTHKVPLVVSHHTQLPKYLHYYGMGRLEGIAWNGIRGLYNRADMTLVTSRAMQELLEDRGVRRVELWPRGVDTQLFHPRRASEEMRARLTQGHPEEKLLIYVGRLSAEKEIERCRPLLEALPGTRLALVGDGPNRARLEEVFAGTPTYFAGYLRGEELASAYASADVFVMPSRTETLGLVLLEAMAAGCPPVAANAGGITDAVEDGVTGRLYDPANPSDAVAAVKALLSDSACRRRLGAQARREAERWSWMGATRQLERFYSSVVQREMELPRQIAGHRARGASVKDVCEALQIPRTALRRHSRTFGWHFFAPSRAPKENLRQRK